MLPLLLWLLAVKKKKSLRLHLLLSFLHQRLPLTLLPLLAPLPLLPVLPLSLWMLPKTQLLLPVPPLPLQ